MSLKFTPPVWKVGTDGDIVSLSADGSVSLVAKVNGQSDESRGNARLIACAPEMYGLLCEVSDELGEAVQEGVITPGVYKVIRKVLALESELDIERHGTGRCSSEYV
ncbi:MAG: hypothetical protein IJG37_06465 [Synergistaceae bacterium]|nr:hypothetical protein [Synergistaceae bacterium]